ncbi:MAG: hypothetical protein ACK56I_24865 [bacterium]
MTVAFEELLDVALPGVLGHVAQVHLVVLRHDAVVVEFLSFLRSTWNQIIKKFISVMI